MTKLASNVRSVLLSVSEGAPLQKYRRDAVLFTQQQDATGIFLIESGLIKLTRAANDGGRLILAVAGSHQLVGEECLTQGVANHMATSTCLTDVTGHHIPLANLKRMLGVGELTIALFTYMISRQREFTQKMEMLTLRDVEHRVLYGLATLAALVKPTPDGASFPIPMTQAEIAAFVGATRETTSTTLSHLKRRELLRLSRRLVVTVHPDLLINAANDRLSRARAAHH